MQLDTLNGVLMRVLGVDPGLTRCGVGIVEGAPGRTMRMVNVQVIRSNADTDLGERLIGVQDELSALIEAHRPDRLAIERVFSQHNVASVMGTAQAVGVCVLTAARYRLPVAQYTPTEVKAAVTGEGGAGKAQVSAMVQRILRLSAPPKPADAADALAIAIADTWRGSAKRRLAVAAAGST